MTLEKIISLYGPSIGKHLVPRKIELKNGGPFKGVKTFKIELWDVDNHEVIEEVERTASITSETKECIMEVLEYGLIKKLFDRYASK